MRDVDWVQAAIADDSIVGELLLRLTRTSLPPPPPAKSDSSILPLDWTVRQRRSRTLILPAASSKTPPAASTRASPTTPLSWSGATSLSGGGGAVDGFEESSRPPTKRCSGLSRSKVIEKSETTSSKRPRKKKTLAELKVEEDLLLKERKYLKRKLASLRVTWEKQRNENESLKQIKNLQSQPEAEGVTSGASDSEKTISVEIQQNVAVSDPGHPILPSVTRDVPDALPKPKLSKEVEQANKFVLPDLNLPIDEDFS